MAVFISFFPLYLQNIGMDKLQIGSLIAIGSIVSLFAHPFWSYMGDRSQNTRSIVVIMMTGMLFLIQIVFQLNTYTLICVFMLLFYFFQTPLLSQMNTLVLNYMDTPSKSFISYRTWGTLGSAIFALIAGITIKNSAVWNVSTLLTILILIAIGTVLVLPPLRKPSDTPILTPSGFRKVLNPYFLAFMILAVLISIPTAMNTAFVTLYITELGGTNTMVGLAVFLSVILESAVFVLFDRFMKRKLTLMIGLLALISVLYAIRWYITSEATSPQEVVLTQLMNCFTFGGYCYLGTQLTMLFIPRPLRAHGHALYTLTSSGISSMIAGLLGGWLFQNFGGSMMYTVCVALALFGALGFALMAYSIYKNGYQPQLYSEE